MSPDRLVIVVTQNTRQYGTSAFRFRARLRQGRDPALGYLPSVGYGDTIEAAIEDMWTCARAVTDRRVFEAQR